MNILTSFTSIFFFIWIFRNILFWTWLWQLKEYRLDRVLVHLRETEQGRKLLFSPLSNFKWLALFFYIVVIFNGNFLTLFQLIVFCIYAFEAFLVLSEFFRRIHRRPRVTGKAILIVFAGFGFSILAYLLPLLELNLWMLILDRLVTLAVAGIVFLLSYPTELYYDFQIQNAMKKISQHKKLLTIGITGSYGKSSTKEYTAHILAQRFNVLRTKGTNNTSIGVAKTILSGLKKDTEIFVAEMGAYKKGEIMELCQIASPRIGILTAVSSQHASLFGGIQNTISAKYELIQSLPKNGLALFNGNNSLVFDLYRKTNTASGKQGVKKVLYRVSKTSNEKADIRAIQIISSKQGISFTVVKGKQQLKLKAPLIGPSHIENILPGVYLAWMLGMKDEDIARGVSTLKSLPGAMIKTKLANGTVAIDSTFNANPQSIVAVADYMKLYSGKKILVMQPIIELGRHAKLEHYKIGQQIVEVCDFLFLTNKNFYADLKKGALESKKTCKIEIGNPSALSKIIKEKTARGEDHVVVFLGREAGLVLRKLQ